MSGTSASANAIRMRRFIGNPPWKQGQTIPCSGDKGNRAPGPADREPERQRQGGGDQPYGSRARGDYTPQSDIDIAIDAPGISQQKFAQIGYERELFNGFSAGISMGYFDRTNLQNLTNYSFVQYRYAA